MSKPESEQVEIAVQHLYDPAWGEEVGKARFSLAILTSNMIMELPEEARADAWAALIEHQKYLGAAG